MYGTLGYALTFSYDDDDDDEFAFNDKPTQVDHVVPIEFQ